MKRVLEYGPSRPGGRIARWLWRAGLIAPLVLAAFLLLWANDSRREQRQADAVTGSWRTRTVWGMGITRGWSVSESPLAAALRKRGIVWTPRWRLVTVTGGHLVGPAFWVGDGERPVVCDLSGAMQAFADLSTDDELREFVRVMQTGTREEQGEAVSAADQKVSRAWWEEQHKKTAGEGASRTGR